MSDDNTPENTVLHGPAEPLEHRCSTSGPANQHDANDAPLSSTNRRPGVTRRAFVMSGPRRPHAPGALPESCRITR